MIGRGNIMYQVQSNVSHMRGGSADIVMYLNQGIPEPFILAAEVVTMLYCCVVMPCALASHMQWHAAPLAVVLSAFFSAILAVAHEMRDPFHGRLCTFDTTAFLKTTQTACDDLLNLRADISQHEKPYRQNSMPVDRWGDEPAWQDDVRF